MRLGNPFREREPQPRSGWFSCARLIRTVEPIEDPWQILWLDPDSGVAHGERDRFLICTHLDAHETVRLGVGDRVEQQIRGEIVEPVGISRHERRQDRDLKRHFTLLRERTQHIDRLCHDPIQSNVAPAERELSAAATCQF
jgi:hypothetical protein